MARSNSTYTVLSSLISVQYNVINKNDPSTVIIVQCAVVFELKACRVQPDVGSVQYSIVKRSN